MFQNALQVLDLSKINSRYYHNRIEAHMSNQQMVISYLHNAKSVIWYPFKKRKKDKYRNEIIISLIHARFDALCPLWFSLKNDWLNYNKIIYLQVYEFLYL